MSEIGAVAPRGRVSRGRPGSVQRLVRARASNRSSPLTVVLSYLLVIAAALLCVLPFFYILSASLKNSVLLFQYPPEWIPSRPYWGNYEHLINETLFPRWVLNTLVVAGAVTLIKVVIDSMSGYAFAKLQFPFKNVLFVVIIATLMIPFSTILIPLYFTVRSFGLLNSYWALILPALANPIGIFLMRSFIEGLPSDLENAARLDGVSEFGIYRRIILPLVKPGLVVLAVLTFLVQYTAFLWPLVAVNNDSMRVITTGLATQRSVWQVDYGVFAAGAVMAMVPITIFFLLLQRYFIAGSLAGALKQ
jgi:multiple sugar transport system permease protein